MTPQEIKEATTAELLKAYNSATGRSIKKFSSRAAAEKQTTAALSKDTAAVIDSARRSITRSTARLVKGKIGSKKGRPKTEFKVKLRSGGNGGKYKRRDGSKMHVRSKSIRRVLISWMETQPGKTATAAAIDAQFRRDMRGVIRQLLDAGWLEKI